MNEPLDYDFEPVSEQLHAAFEKQQVHVHNEALKALKVQIGGGHYKEFAIQPIQYIHANNIGYAEGNVIKYVTRWRSKGGIADLLKARHYIDLLIELEESYGK